MPPDSAEPDPVIVLCTKVESKVETKVETKVEKRPLCSDVLGKSIEAEKLMKQSSEQAMIIELRARKRNQARSVLGIYLPSEALLSSYPQKAFSPNRACCREQTVLKVLGELSGWRLLPDLFSPWATK